MEPIRVVAGTGTGPTPVAAYDAALAGAGVENYNLVRVSSVVPAGATILTPGRAPDLGAVGDRLTVVEARATAPDRAAAAALAWGRTAAGPRPDGADDHPDGRTGDPATGDPTAADPPTGDPRGPGLFYEAAAEGPEATAEAVRSAADRGLTAGADRRGWELATRDRTVAVAARPDAAFATAVVLAVYGDGDPLL